MTQKFPIVGDLFEQRYELIAELGSGGVGTVFKARQIDADRLIALKVLHTQIGSDEEYKQRFFREAQALNKIRHENIVTVYYLCLSELALPYMAMELINGASLRKILVDTGRLPFDRVIKIVTQLCSALSCMHESGIIHRDLKPENIMLLQDSEIDTVKIIDFGLVRVDFASEQKLTATGVLMGSANYMSPEQCKGQIADARSDIYALTVCMFEMLAGAPPFGADNPVGLMYKHVNLRPPELRLPSGEAVQALINEFVGRGLEKDPALRFQTSTEMSQSLSVLAERCEGKANSPAATFNPMSRSATTIALVTLCILLALAAAFVWKQKIQRKNVASTEYMEHLKADKSLEQAYKQRLAKAEKEYGPNSPEILSRLNELFMLYFREGRYVDAEAVVRRTINIRERNFGGSDHVLAVAMDDLAGCFELEKKFAQAEPLLKRSLDIRLKILDPTDREVMLGQDFLGYCYEQQSKFEKAEVLFKRSLALRETKHVDVEALCLGIDNLANCYEQEQNWGKAESLYKRTLAIKEKSLGANDESVAISLDCLGICYNSEGNYAKAESLFKRALAIRERALRPNDLAVAACLDCLGICYDREGKYTEARPLFTRAIAIRENALNKNDAAVAASLAWLAECFNKEGKYAEAKPLLERAATIKEKALVAHYMYVGEFLSSMLDSSSRESSYGQTELLKQGAKHF